MCVIKRLFSRRTQPRRARHLELGSFGEQAALEYLKYSEGYQIVATNYRVPFGRGVRGQKLNGEIDIIAYDNATLVFVEVKTRMSSDIASPEQSVDLRKRRQIARAAQRYKQIMSVVAETHRYDVVTVIPTEHGPRIELLRAYFDDSVFRFRKKSDW
jgi:putative endonuclease